jgi:hypothetical protein
LLSSGMPIPKRLMELEQSINEELSKANLPQIKIDGFKLPDQALELSFERETVTGVNRDKMWEIINSNYKRIMSELELVEN